MEGRADECGALDRVLERARNGESTAMLIEGEPGVGKTVLCEYAAGRARGFSIVRTAGIESESHVAFAGLSLLVAPLVDHLDQIPEPQRRALAGALAMEQASPTPELTLGLATLNLLAAGAHRQPLLAIVDDAHWLDASSREAIAFAARRIAHESVVLLFAQRPAEEGSLSSQGLELLHLSGLQPDDAQALLSHVVGAEIPDSVAGALVEATGGNPMALIEAASSLPAAVLAGREPLPDPLLLGGDVASAQALRIAALPERTRRALLVVAADATGSLALVDPALHSQGLDLATLEPAEALDIVRLDGVRATFRHPLLRSAAYGTATAAQRRAAHQALADVAVTAGSRESAAWHLAAATPGPDERIAALLEEAAHDAELVGGAAAAAPALERAARLTPTGETRARRLATAASAMFLAGRPERIDGLLDEALQLTDDTFIRADVVRVRAQLMVAQGNSDRAVALIRREAKLVAPVDPEKATMMLCEMAVPSTWSGDGHAVREMALEIGEVGRDVTGPVAAAATSYLAHILIFAGDTQRGRELIWKTHDEWKQRPVNTGFMMPGPSIGLLCIEAYDDARTVAHNGIDEARSLGAPAATLFQLGALSEVEFYAGDWVSSYAAATECTNLAQALGNRPQEGYGLVGQARVEAAQGRREECEAHVRVAMDITGNSDTDYIYVYAAYARGLLELGLGRAEAAYSELAPLTNWLFDRGWAGMLNKERFASDLVEAAIIVGARDEAAQLIERFAAVAIEANHLCAQACMLRCRGLLAAGDEAEGYFRDALTLHDQAMTPFEKARTELRFGEWLRHRDRRADAIGLLRRAHATFDRLGAAPWTERARQELLSAGDASAPSDAGLLESLTPQELQVAVVVADGASNKDAAAALFLSPRTVEFHLGRVYRKLGIHSRSQLTRLVLSERGISAPAEA